MENQVRRSSCRRQRVVLFPLPFQGHVNPMLQLANILYYKGFAITIVHTKFNSSYTSNYPHFTFRAVLDNESSKDNNNLANLSSKGIGDLLWGVMTLNQCGEDSLRQELDQMLMASRKQQEPIVCLITDALWYFTQSVADSLKLPRIVLRTSSLFCVTVYASIPVFDDQGYFDQVNSVFGEESIDLGLKNITSPNEQSNVKKPDGNELVLNLEERVPEIPVLKMKDISKMRIKGQTDPTAKILANMLKQTKASSGIIWNSFKELEEPELQKIRKDFPVPSFVIGPFHKYFPASLSSLIEPDRSFMSWLDHQAPNSVLYISFGSAAQLNKQDFLEVAHGLANSKQPFLWVMRPGFVKGSEWIEVLPNGFLDLVGERGHIVKWAPQQEVLAHQATGAFWTHNGWNSTLESICEGVPMICSPFWGDQPLDARYVTDVLKVAVYLENGWVREEIASAIRRVMVDEEREEFRERARCLKDKVNGSLMKGGSSYESLESLVGYISSL